MLGKPEPACYRTCMITSNIFTTPVAISVSSGRSTVAPHALEPLDNAVAALVPHGTTNVPSPDAARAALAQADFAIKVLDMAKIPGAESLPLLSQAIDKVHEGAAQLQQFLTLADPYRAAGSSALTFAAQRDFRAARQLAAQA